MVLFVLMCSHLRNLPILSRELAQQVLDTLYHVLRQLLLALPKQERHGVVSAVLNRALPVYPRLVLPIQAAV